MRHQLEQMARRPFAFINAVRPVGVEHNLKRLVEFATKTASQLWVKDARKNFNKFVFEHDRRRGTNFLDTFPEMKDFLDAGK